MTDDDLFGWAMFNAIIAAYQMERPRIEAEAPPAAEAPSIAAPPGCDIYRHGGAPKFRAKVWYDGATRTLGYFPATPEGYERARACAEAAYAARNAGADLATMTRAGRDAGGLA